MHLDVAYGVNDLYKMQLFRIYQVLDFFFFNVNEAMFLSNYVNSMRVVNCGARSAPWIRGRLGGPGGRKFNLIFSICGGMFRCCLFFDPRG